MDNSARQPVFPAKLQACHYDMFIAASVSCRTWRARPSPGQHPHGPGACGAVENGRGHMRLARDTRQTLDLAIEALIELDTIELDPNAEPSLGATKAVDQDYGWDLDAVAQGHAGRTSQSTRS